MKNGPHQRAIFYELTGVTHVGFYIPPTKYEAAIFSDLS